MKAEAYQDCRAVLKWGIASRICLFLLQVISNNVIPDHTGSMEDVFMKGYRHPPHHALVEATLGGFDNWDSEHFVFIGEHGYGVHEQTMAFFPFFPALLWTLSHSFLRPLLIFLPVRSVLLIAGFVLNLSLFPLVVMFLYLLTLSLSKDRQFSLLAAALFCINPASVFMSALYTECLFALFTFSGLLALERGRSWIAALLFMLATATRSNGIVLCGYIGYRCLHKIFGTITTQSFSVIVKESFLILITAVLQCVLVVLPFVLFQYHGYQLYCVASNTSQDQIPPPEWCNWRLPLPYNYIQEHYWNNGFLRYFQLKQIPNFMLAAPMIVLSSCCIVNYFKGSAMKVKVEEDKEKSKSNWLQSEHMRPYTFHLMFLLLFGTFFMNVQVITRFICSSSPLIYWYSASLLLPTLSSRKPALLLEPKVYNVAKMAGGVFKTVFSQTGLTGSKLVLGYFVLYVVLGFVLHCNFYPWT